MGWGFGWLLGSVFVLTSHFALAAGPSWKGNAIDLGLQNEDRPWSVSLKDWVENPDGLALTFEAQHLPAWMELDSDTGRLHGTPLRQDVGTYDGIELSVVSVAGRETASASGEVLITYHPPRWTKSDVTLPDAREQYGYSQALNSWVENREKVELKFSLVSVTPPEWVHVGSSTGAVYGMPPNNSSGNLQLRIKLSATVNGKHYEDTALFRLTVVDQNRAPLWKANPLFLPGALTGRFYEQNLADSVTDPDQDPLSFKLLSGPKWATLDPQGRFWGTPTSADAGKAVWVVEAVDGEGARSQTQIRVRTTKTNQPPQWQAATLTLPDAVRGRVYEVDLGRFVRDPDGDPLQFTGLDIPEGMQIGAGGSLVWVPGKKDVGPVKITIRAEDGKGGNASADFSFFVDDSKHPPFWALNPIILNADQDKSFSADLNAYVQNPDGVSLTFELVHSAGWGTLSQRGVLSGTASSDFVGESIFEVRVSDPHGLGDTASVHVRVAARNHPPRWSVIQLPAATEGAPYESSVAQFASDPDASDSLTFSKVGQSPSWLLIARDGMVSGTPGPDAVGKAKVRVRVMDAQGALAETQFVLQVEAINHPPRWRQSPLYLGDAFENQPFDFNLHLYAQDPDGQKVIFSMVSGPTWLHIEEQRALGQPARGDIGPFEVVFRAGDGSQWSDVVAQGQVLRQNHAPILSGEWPVIQVQERQTVRGTLNDSKYVSDPDGDTLHFLLKQRVSWVRLGDNGEFVITPPSGQRGPRAFAVSVDDGTDSVSGALQIDVLPNPRPPVWSADPIQRLALSNTPIRGSIAAFATDHDGLALGFVKKSGNSWLTIQPDGTLEGVPLESELGVQSFTVGVCNADKQCADTTLLIDVQKGLACDSLQLGQSVEGARTHLVWALDPSESSENLIAALRQNRSAFEGRLKKRKVGFDLETWKTTTAGATDGIQSPLWSLYQGLTSQTLPPLTEVLVVSRQRDYFYWFSNRFPEHKGIPAQRYLQSLETRLPKSHRSWRVSVIAPSCPHLGEVLNEKTPPLEEGSYYQWTRKTGGKYFDNKCQLNVPQWLDSWADSVAFWANLHAKRSLPLSRRPVAGSVLDVTINGIPLNTGTWRYDPVKNAIELDWSQVDKRPLQPADYLEVKYLPQG